ncbi:MAG: fumarylacetoacetate hydrolase family protein [Pseudomonadota bacterium]
MDDIFTAPAIARLAILGGGAFPVRRIFCIGKNYAAHVTEMGGDPKSDPPVFFTKPADAATQDAVVPFPPGTQDLHYEGELVIALKAGGRALKTRGEAGALILGAAVGCDLTRRDLQRAAKDKGAPWDAAKGFDFSAPVGQIATIGDVPPDAMDEARIITHVNGAVRQDAPLSDMIWTVPEIIIALSALFELKAGDLIFTGTPQGVGPLAVGDTVEVNIDPLPPLTFTIGAPA